MTSAPLLKRHVFAVEFTVCDETVPLGFNPADHCLVQIKNEA